MTTKQATPHPNPDAEPQEFVRRLPGRRAAEEGMQAVPELLACKG